MQKLVRKNTDQFYKRSCTDAKDRQSDRQTQTDRDRQIDRQRHSNVLIPHNGMIQLFF